MRLIDADELIKKFKYSDAHTDDENVWCATFRRMIKEQPTAYDIDKVVEALEKEKNIHTEHFCTSIYKDMPEIKQRYKQALGIIDKAIEIVEQGRREQK